MKRSALLWRAALAAGLAAVAIAAPASAQAAAPAFGQDGAVPAGFASWSEVFGLQARMNAVAGRIAAAAQADTRSGYAGVLADPLTRELRVYWKGQPPADLTAPADRSVPVRVLPAAYTQRELVAAANRLLARAGDQVTQVGPKADGSGLLVGTSGADVPAASYAGVAATVQANVSPTASTRVDDAPPWSGGARWNNATAGVNCSTGFAIRHGGANRTLSAGHCGVVGDIANDPTGQRIGTVQTDVAGNDVLVISGNSQGRVYVNTMTADGQVVREFTARVVGQAGSVAGNLVCSSGSFSGSRCNIQVIAINQCINVTGVGRVCGQVQADQRSRTNAGGQGDSGGPVFLSPSDTSQVTAVGTVTARDDANAPATCTGYVPTGRLCSWRLYYEDLATGLGAVGGTLILG